jgi:hypothetical protein
VNDASRDDRLVLALVTLSAAASACFVSSDGDLGFHLATGREVLASGRIPSLNVLSYTEPQQLWRLHQWLPATLFELVFQRAGITGVIATKMAVIAATWAIVYRTARRLGAAPFPAGLACFGAIAASAFRFEARPYIFTHLTLAWILLLASSRRSVLAIAVVTALGLQLHASIDGLLALLVLAAGGFAQALRPEPRVASGLRAASPLLLAAGLGLALGAAALQAYHPIGASILLFAFEMGSDPYLAQHLIEFRPLHRFPLELLPLTWAWLAVVLATAVTRRRVMHAGQLALLLVFGLLALRFARMAYAFAIVSAPLVAAALCRAPLQLPAVRPQLRAALLAACALAAPLYVFRDHAPGFGYAPSSWPHAHFAFVRQHHLAGHAFVSNAWAGPFLGVFYPERKSFFDMRLEAYSPNMLREVYQRIAYGLPGWDALLDRYDVQWLLLRYTTPGEAALQGGAPNLRQRLASDPRFTLVRFDDDGELFVRSAGPNAALARRLGMSCVDPDRGVFTRQPDPACVQAMQLAVRTGNRSQQLSATTALSLARCRAAHAKGCVAP